MHWSGEHETGMGSQGVEPRPGWVNSDESDDLL